MQPLPSVLLMQDGGDRQEVSPAVFLRASKGIWPVTVRNRILHETGLHSDPARQFP